MILVVFIFYGRNFDGMFLWNYAAEDFRGIMPRKLSVESCHWKISVELCREKCPRNYAAESFRGTLPRKVSAEL